MEKKDILGLLFVISITAILFTPRHSDAWKIPLFFGIIFGIFWYMKS
jgi:hypothetical protein